MKIKVVTPKRMRFCLDSEELNTLFQKRNIRFRKALIKSLASYAGYKNIQSVLIFESKSFENTNNTIEETRCCDRVIATTYISRTEFNHQEALWSVFTDVFPYIKKHLKEISKF